jgi:ABC-type sugar transport system permease subunit
VETTLLEELGIFIVNGMIVILQIGDVFAGIILLLSGFMWSVSGFVLAITIDEGEKFPTGLDTIMMIAFGWVLGEIGYITGRMLFSEAIAVLLFVVLLVIGVVFLRFVVRPAIRRLLRRHGVQLD